MKKRAKEKQSAEAEAKQCALEIKSKAEALVSALGRRKLRVGLSKYKEHSGHRRPALDRSGILHWPVLLLYGEFMISDLIEDFAETDMFRSHLETMFGKDASPLTWDSAKVYKRDRVELYYQANGGAPPLWRVRWVWKAWI